MQPRVCQVLLRKPNAIEDPKLFTFDQVFDETATQKMLYDDTARLVVDSVIAGYNGTIFAYGQTGRRG